MRRPLSRPVEACSILDDLASIVTDCFADFSEAVQSTMSWAPAWTPQHLKAHDVSRCGSVTTLGCGRRCPTKKRGNV